MKHALVILLAAIPAACLDSGDDGSRGEAEAEVTATDGGATDTTGPSDGVDSLTSPPPDTAAETADTVDTRVEPDTTVTEDTADQVDTAEPLDTAVDGAVIDTAAPDGLEDCPVCSERRPLILVHGINGGPGNYDVMVERLLADGWPEDYVVRFEAADPSWGCNVDNAHALDALVEQTRERTCQGRVDIVAHSMGTLSSRYYIKNLGGAERVNTYVTLGGMHHGLFTPCLAPDFLGVCVWQELCQSGDFIAQLNADPATPGSLHWVSIYGTADRTVPNESSHLDDAENIVIEGAEHDGENGLLQREDAYEEVLRVLGYDCW